MPDHKTIEELEAHIAKLEKANLALRDSACQGATSVEDIKARYMGLFDSFDEAYVLHEIICNEQGTPIDYRFLDANPAFEKSVGMKKEDVIGKTVMELLPKTEAIWIERFGQVALTGQSTSFAHYAAALDRHFEVYAFSLLVSAGLFAMLVIDRTEQELQAEAHKKLEQKIQHAQKLESLGVLAGGIAHDFNNLLVGILGHAELIHMDLPEGSPCRSHVDEIRTITQRASELTNQMLAYSGRSRFNIAPTDINHLVEEMGHLLRVSIFKKTILHYDLADYLPPIEAEAAQLRQVVMNLITNASDAIGDKSGTISIHTSLVECTAEFLREFYLDDDLPPGYYVSLEISDTGCGMDSETQLKVFEPFFTTKFAGRGLGMAAVLGIIRGHHGAIKIYSEVGVGTTFKIFLPATENATPVVKETPDETITLSIAPTILIVDDEPSIRNIVKMHLERAGMTVLTAPDGLAGLKVYEENADAIDLVLLDLSMPHLNGEETYRRLHQMNPGLQVILISGYSEQEAMGRFVGKGLAGFLQKPFPAKVLIQKISQALGTHKPPDA